MHIQSGFGSKDSNDKKLKQPFVDFYTEIEHVARATLTWPKVNSGVQSLYRATLEVAGPGSIGGEQHHLVTKVRPEQLGQVTQVVVVTCEVAAIFILHLQARKSRWSKLFSSGGVVMPQEAEFQIHLHSNNGTTMLV